MKHVFSEVTFSLEYMTVVGSFHMEKWGITGDDPSQQKCKMEQTRK
jgi:hypothetical protein